MSEIGNGDIQVLAQEEWASQEINRLKSKLVHEQRRVEGLEKSLTGVLDNHHASGVPRCYCPACDAAYAALADPDGGADELAELIEAAVNLDGEAWGIKSWEGPPTSSWYRFRDAVAAYKAREGGG